MIVGIQTTGRKRREGATRHMEIKTRGRNIVEENQKNKKKNKEKKEKEKEEEEKSKKKKKKTVHIVPWAKRTGQRKMKTVRMVRNEGARTTDPARKAAQRER